ncbi:hypothetical protein HK414_16555 [Ramlibacter terrae]|uniref:Uncharacterized protein n=1 Tax=Ramlibacter terrae TaxID=2732511 RepID=A0ABX6P3M2_9BURK|nr:hypothetical protein HK414_16555 [Ramlibacter terrae]
MHDAITLQPAAGTLVPVADAVLRPLGAALSRPALADAAAAFCAELAEGLRCDRVTVGLLAGDDLQLAGSSHPGALLAAQPAASGIVDAMHEALDQRRRWLGLPSPAPMPSRWPTGRWRPRAAPARCPGWTTTEWWAR